MKHTWGVSLNTATSEQEAELFRTLQDTPNVSQFIKDALVAHLTGAPVAQVGSGASRGPGLSDAVADELRALIAAQQREINTLRADLKALQERPSATATVEPVQAEDGTAAYRPAPAKDKGRKLTEDEAMKIARAAHRPGLKLEQ